MSAHFSTVECVRVAIEDPDNRGSFPRVKPIEAIEKFREWLASTNIYPIHTPVSGPHVYVAYFVPDDAKRAREFLLTVLPDAAGLDPNEVEDEEAEQN